MAIKGTRALETFNDQLVSGEQAAVLKRYWVLGDGTKLPFAWDARVKTPEGIAKIVVPIFFRVVTKPRVCHDVDQRSTTVSIQLGLACG
jgi:hypothetical protein